MIKSGYQRPHTRFKMATRMGPGVSSVHEAMSYDGSPKYVSGFSGFSPPGSLPNSAAVCIETYLFLYTRLKGFDTNT